MQTIFMLSGVDKVSGFYLNQKEYLKKEIKDNYTVTFIASCFDNPSQTDLFFNNTLDFFENINIVFSKVNLIDYRVSKEDAKKFIKESDLLYIMGGDAYKEFQYIIEYDLIDSIRDFTGIIIGVSAGALNLSENVCYLDQYRNNQIVKYKGLGLTNINIYPHFDITNKDFLAETLLVSRKIKLYALPNESFILIKDNEFKIIGNYYLCENGLYSEVK